jgi:hypothetical protein
VSWPAALGTRPTPVNGVVTFTPTATGTYNIVFQVQDAAGALSPNTGSGSVNVLSAETVLFTKAQFTPASNRWVVTGSDTVHEGQTLTIVYSDGKTRSSAVTCNGTALPECVLGTVTVDAAGNWTLDKIVAAGSALDPTSTTYWSRVPTTVKAYSSAPVLGGSGSSAILKK